MKKYLTKLNLTLLLILILGGILRIYKLDSFPALNADEAALGYNAYSLLKTGLDEHGNSWPIYFQSFNDFKPALTGYFMMPVIYLFGISELTVRIIPALLSAATVLVIYNLVVELFKNPKLGLISAFLLAVNPWHIHYSRGAWEVNVATFFIALGLLFFLKSLRRKYYLLGACVSFILSLYSYHAARIIIPLLGVGITMLYWREILKNLRVVIFSAVMSLILCTPIIVSFIKPNGLARASGVALWSDAGPTNRANELRGDYSDTNGIVPKLLHNKPIAYSIAFLNNYTEHFWGEFLFLSGDDIQRNKVPETGQLYLVEFLFVGVAGYVISKNLNRGWSTILLWCLIAPIPAAITFQSPHALRSESMSIPLEIISAFGIYTLIEGINLLPTRKIVRFGSLLAFKIMIVWFVGNYIHEYYFHMPKEFPYSSQYGLKELAEYIRPVEEKYNNIIITDRYDQPYILFLFYGAKSGDKYWEPESFQKKHTLTSRDLFGFSTVRNFKNFRFESVDFSKIQAQYPGSLIVGTEKEIPKEANVIKDINGDNGYKYFRIVEN